MSRRVVHLPVYDENPYQPGLMRAQKELGWTTIDGGGGGNFIRTALRDWKPDVVHVHWLHPYLLRNRQIASWLRGTRFLAEIKMLRLRGAKIAWTVHNLKSHEGTHPRIERFLTRRFARLCDLIFTHGEFASQSARELFRIPGRIPLIAIRHPNYCSDDQPALSMAEARSKMGIESDRFVISFVGRVERYKQILELIDAFHQVADDRAQLIIAGSASDNNYRDEILHAISSDSRIRFVNQYVEESQIPLYMGAANVVACPSKGILTSGSVLLAMSYGRAVIAPASGCLPETIGEAGFLYSENDPNGLAVALATAIEERDNLNIKGELALEIAQQASPKNIAKTIVASYESILPDSGHG